MKAKDHSHSTTGFHLGGGASPAVALRVRARPLSRFSACAGVPATLTLAGTLDIRVSNRG
jgi:hypothetical protein